MPGYSSHNSILGMPIGIQMQDTLDSSVTSSFSQVNRSSVKKRKTKSRRSNKTEQLYDDTLFRLIKDCPDDHSVFANHRPTDYQKYMNMKCMENLYEYLG